MKAFYFFALLSFVSFSAAAQNNLFTPEYKQQLLNHRLSLPFIVQQNAKVINQTESGTVYALPQDNMPCFVPSLNSISKIPTYKYLLPVEKMLNANAKPNFIPGMNNTNLTTFNFILFPKSESVLFNTGQLQVGK